MCLTPIRLKNPTYRGRIGEFLYNTLPCGHCAECLSTRIEDWIIRLKEELRVSQYSLFLTLTYNDDNLPDGNLPSKKDVQLFHRYLRRKGLKFKYFIVSENGEQYNRIHYHGIYFFTAYIEDLYSILVSTWNKGYIFMGDANGKTIRYVTKYILKDFGGTKDNFYLMSKNLGLNYVERMLNWHRSDLLNRCYYPDGKFKKHMPRYYRNKIYTENEKSLINHHQDLHLSSQVDCFSSGEFYNQIQNQLEKQRRWERKIQEHKNKKKSTKF